MHYTSVWIMRTHFIDFFFFVKRAGLILSASNRNHIPWWSKTNHQQHVDKRKNTFCSVNESRLTFYLFRKNGVGENPVLTCTRKQQHLHALASGASVVIAICISMFIVNNANLAGTAGIYLSYLFSDEFKHSHWPFLLLLRIIKLNRYQLTLSGLEQT